MTERLTRLPTLTIERVLSPGTSFRIPLEGRNAAGARLGLAEQGVVFVLFSSASLATHSLEGRLGALASVTVTEREPLFVCELLGLTRARLVEVESFSPELRVAVDTLPDQAHDGALLVPQFLARAAKTFPDRIALLRLEAMLPDTRVNLIASWLSLSFEEQLQLFELPSSERAKAVLALDWGPVRHDADRMARRLQAFRLWLLSPARWWFWALISCGLAIALCAWMLTWMV